MLNILNKHHWCITFLLTFIGTIVYTCLWYEDVADDRYYPISLSERDEITIDYQTPYIVSNERCFRLGFSIRNTDDIEHYNKYYHTIYRDLTEEEYYSDIANKPKLHIRIFKDNKLIKENDMYVTDISSHGDVVIDNKEHWLYYINLSFGYRENNCYYFSPHSSYKLIVTNLVPKEFYKNIEVFFGIEPIKPR